MDTNGHTTLSEDYVSFEVAKLLKEKEFNNPCLRVYDNKGIICIRYTGFDVPHDYFNRQLYLCSTHQMAMKWLREKYNIYINIRPDFPSDKDYKMYWCWSANILHENCISMKGYRCYIETYEQACEEALKFSLENLI